MTTIRVLPSDLVSRIAAGEVVERPAAVLKELIENALDAGAREIRVSIEGAGRVKLTVSDDGSGMSRDDARLSLHRHATSKISALEDLDGIATFGFRGEALPSIASVSRLTMTTRTAGSDEAWRLVVHGGTIVEETPDAREPGTTIEVADLFFNTPARFKFMKSDGTERSQAIRVVEEAAFAAPHVTLQLQVEKGKPAVFKSAPANFDITSLLSDRATVAWGARVAKDFLGISSSSAHFSVKGVVSHPNGHQATARFQCLYINRRPVQNRRLARAVINGYLGALPTMRYPAWILFLDVDPRSVDVNVHPTKREVKLTHESEIFAFLQEAIKSALVTRPARDDRRITEVPTPVRSSGIEFPVSVPSASRPSFAEVARTSDLYRPLDVATPFQSTSEKAAAVISSFRGRSFQAIAQIHLTYIVAESEGTLFLFDQHAAAERVAYERLLGLAGAPLTQRLLVPFTWEVARSLAPAIRDRLSEFQSIGFEIEPFGDETFVVKGYPQALGETYDMASLLDSLTDTLAEGSSSGRADRGFRHRLAAMAACKASVRAGDRLPLEASQALLEQWSQCDSPFTCPHGRPAFLSWGQDELERRFRRT